PQRADALIGHGILLSEPRLLTPRSSDRSIRPVTTLPSIPDTTSRAAPYRAVTEFERRQLAAVRKELDQEYEAQVGLKTQLSKDATPMKISSNPRT
ncbi:MAG: hypothetical protein WB820_08410, partial [Rhodoplanes sp.]